MGKITLALRGVMPRTAELLGLLSETCGKTEMANPDSSLS
jgi:hypothetical protein